MMIFNLITSLKTLFPTQVTSTGPMAGTCLLGITSQGMGNLLGEAGQN
jgi:hypothetical protein